MTVFRSLIYLFLLAVSVIFYSLFLTTVGGILDYETRCRYGNQWARFNLHALRWICGLGFRVQGLDHLPSSNCIVMSKHQSAWETIALRALLPPQQAWVVKNELLKVPFFGMALRRFEPIAIDRKLGRKAVKQVVEQGIRALEMGRWVVIFPEGTRVAPGERKRYGIGGALLADKSGYSVVPIAHNAGVFWKRRGIRKHSGTIDMIVGEPIPTSGKSATQISQEIEEWIETRVADLPAVPTVGGC